MGRALGVIVVAGLAAGCGGEADPPPCTPTCEGRACGVDPVCGTECGACADGFACGADHACADVDECAAGGCGVNATCTNEVGGFTCACPPTFEPDPTPLAACRPSFALEPWDDGVVWYGFRQLRAGWLGPAFTAIKPGGATFDVPFVGARLDLAGLDDFAAGGEVLVDTLQDQLGLGRDASSVGGRPPRIVPVGNDHRAMSFDRIEGLASTGAATALDRASHFTFFMPVRWSGAATADQGHLFTVGRGAPETGDWPFAMLTMPTTSELAAGRVQAQLQTAAAEYRIDAEGTVGRAGAFELHEVVFDASAGLSYLNSGRLVGNVAVGGGAPLVSLPAAGADRVVTIGNNAALTRGFDGLAYPPVVFDRALSGVERLVVRQELAAYYGVELPAPRPPEGDEFTIVLIPDTQRYAEETNGLSSQIITRLMQWAATNQAAWNIQMVTQVGDIVNNTQPIQYERAMAWYRILDDAAIPYTVAIGNHDYANVPARDSTLYNTYFTQAHYTARPWWNGAFFEAGKTDNLWFTATLGGEPYVFLTLEYQPRQAVVDWANALLTTHADKRAVIVTHDFMTPTGAFSTARAINGGNVGAELYAELFSQHDNVFLVLSGHHVRGSAYRHDRATGANYLFLDPTFLDGASSPETWGNEGYAQLLVVSPSKHTIRVMTFSPDLGVHRTDLKSLFTLDF